MITEKGPEQEQKIEIKDPNKELSPNELKQELSRLKTKYCTDLGEELGMQLTMPADTKVGGIDVGGKTLAEVFDQLMAPLEHYEPPIIREQPKEIKEKSSETPVWLKGNEKLMWKGAHENPRWKLQAKPFGNKIRVNYLRRDQELRPGRNKNEQGRELALIEDTFTKDEWRVAQTIFDSYDKIDMAREKGDKQARKKFLEILREENEYRQARGAMPEILSKEVEDAIDFISESTRGFKKEKIDQERLTQKIAEILSQLVVLNFTRGEGKERVPQAKKSIKEFPTFVENLKGIAGSLSRQVKENKGVALILGEPGTGKNEALEYIAAKTERPYFVFACGRGMKAQELVVHYEFDTKEGTKKFLTDLASGLQTPGAIVQIDEYNSLKENVQAVFHGMGDDRRSFEYDGIKIPLADGVVVAFTGNPATGGAAGDMAAALLDRTGGQRTIMEYPALRKGEMIARKEKWSESTLVQKETEDNTLRDYACDEAQVTKEQFNEFSELTDSEFALLWDVIINETTQAKRIDELKANPKLANLVEDPLKDHVVKLLIGLRDIERVADAWRKYFEKKTGGFTIGISMRGINSVTRLFKETGDVRKAFLTEMDIFRKQPIQGLDEVYASLEELLNDTLGATA